MPRVTSSPKPLELRPHLPGALRRPHLEHAETVLQELAGLRTKVSRAGNEIFSHDSAAHDDLVFAVALANWQATKDKWHEPESQQRLL